MAVTLPDKKLFRVDEVATICSVHPDTVRNWTKTGKLKRTYLPNGRVRIAREDLAGMLASAPDDDAPAIKFI